MKINRSKLFISVVVLFCVSNVTTTLFSQSVGVNITDPKALFHIDSQGNNAGGIYSDDIVINTQGNITIGSNTPSTSAKVSIANGGNMIVETSENKDTGYSLISDADGNASWGVVVGATGILEDRIQIGTTAADVLMPYGSPNDLPNSKFTPTQDGLYVFDIRYNVNVDARSVGTNSLALSMANHLRLILDDGAGDIDKSKANVQDEYEGYQDIKASTNQTMAFYTSLSSFLKKGQKVKFDLRIGQGMQVTIPKIVSTNDGHFEIVVKRYNFKQ